MADIKLPQLGFSMDEGQLTAWLVEDGAMVTEGQPIYEMEGDKAVQEVEAPASGKLRIIAAVDKTYPVGTLLGTID